MYISNFSHLTLGNNNIEEFLQKGCISRFCPKKSEKCFNLALFWPSLQILYYRVSPALKIG